MYGTLTHLLINNKLDDFYLIPLIYQYNNYQFNFYGLYFEKTIQIYQINVIVLVILTQFHKINKFKHLVQIYKWLTDFWETILEFKTKQLVGVF